MAQAKSNKVDFAQKSLRLQKFRTFLPLEQETRQCEGSTMISSRPLFPGYLFVGLDMTQDFWSQVNTTFDVVRIVNFGKLPATVPTQLVTEFMERCDSRGVFLSPNQKQLADQARITQDPFADFVAKIENIARDRRVGVLVDTIEAKTRRSSPVNQICLIESKRKPCGTNELDKKSRYLRIVS
ncbi:MAG: transcription termination/antitermination protein NusG [Spongiibacteraceae bacterium]